MSNQMEDGWYPECDDCGCGNLVEAHTYCGDCFKKLKQEIISSERERIKGIINSLTTDGSYLTQEQVKYLLKEIDKEVKTE
jgi:hypothetical protein